MSESNVLRCAVIVYRGQWSMRQEPCGKPAKGIRTTPNDAMWPVCGIHLRAKRGMVEVRPGRYRALREKGQSA
jgi:hypothetical protein